jgi:membrane-associated protein
MAALVDLVLHVDRHLFELSAQYGPWVYLILFLIVFAETGLVVTPFLPGDSLLFATGTLAAAGVLDLETCALLLTVAAIVGDAVNYAVGRRAGPRIFTASDTSRWWGRLIDRQHLVRAAQFFDRHGGKAVVLARFVPIVRTFVPFVAGAGSMVYSRFAFFNVSGALLWVGTCVGAGYAFGNIPIVKENFSLVVLGIVFVSLVPAIVELLRHRKAGTGRTQRSTVLHSSTDELGGSPNAPQDPFVRGVHHHERNGRARSAVRGEPGVGGSG